MHQVVNSCQEVVATLGLAKTTFFQPRNRGERCRRDPACSIHPRVGWCRSSVRLTTCCLINLMASSRITELPGATVGNDLIVFLLENGVAHTPQERF